MMAGRLLRNMVGLPGSWCLTSISGKVPNGSPDCASWRRTNAGFGCQRVTIITVTPGKKNATVEESQMRQPLDWQIASVRAIKPETAHVKTFTLALPNWTEHRAGQHYDIRLTAEDGYQAQRSYSIASEPQPQGAVALTMEPIE